MMKRVALCLVLAACGSTQGMSGPTVSGRMGAGDDEPIPAIQSNDILARDQRTSKVEVKHILIGWRQPDKGTGHKQDPRAAARSREEADALAVALLARVRAGESMDALMAEYSEDQGSAATAKSYTVTADAGLVFEFKRLGLRLDAGEAGLVKTEFGWHIIKRVE
jgi:hypothetical protein